MTTSLLGRAAWLLCENIFILVGSVTVIWASSQGTDGLVSYFRGEVCFLSSFFPTSKIGYSCGRQCMTIESFTFDQLEFKLLLCPDLHLHDFLSPAMSFVFKT